MDWIQNVNNSDAINEKFIEVSIGKGFCNLWWVQFENIKTGKLIKKSKPFKTKEEAIIFVDKYKEE